ncbi:tyrosine-type recombinase/integrase [Microseira sp. BLCC-F43]|uniref:tyrosine-type recombinase/integrase n=1 Tax=Microseira sp. BLCC-F43 TaxID=3153602 RepID=UPI0035B6F671
MITFNPFDNLPKVSGGKKTSQVNPFSPEEKELIVSTFEADPCYSYYTSFVRFLFLTGCRTSEAIGLQWKHVSPNLSVITFNEAFVCGKRSPRTKTGKIRKFPINETLRSLLKTIKPTECTPDTLVFPSPSGLPIDGHNFLNRAWKSILGQLPIQYRSVYHTGHTFISSCLEAGIRVTQVAQWVGNSPDTIWRHYAGVINEATVPE